MRQLKLTFAITATEGKKTVTHGVGEDDDPGVDISASQMIPDEDMIQRMVELGLDGREKTIKIEGAVAADEGGGNREGGKLKVKAQMRVKVDGREEETRVIEVDAEPGDGGMGEGETKTKINVNVKVKVVLEMEIGM